MTAATFWKLFFGSLVPVPSGGCCLPVTAIGIRSINASPGGRNTVFLKNFSSIFLLTAIWNTCWLIQPLFAPTLVLPAPKKTRRAIFRQKSRWAFNQDSSGNGCSRQRDSLYFNRRAKKRHHPSRSVD